MTLEVQKAKPRGQNEKRLADAESNRRGGFWWTGASQLNPPRPSPVVIHVRVRCSVTFNDLITQRLRGGSIPQFNPATCCGHSSATCSNFVALIPPAYRSCLAEVSALLALRKPTTRQRFCGGGFK